MVLANNDQMAKKLVNCTFVILNILYRLVGGQYLCGGEKCLEKGAPIDGLKIGTNR